MKIDFPGLNKAKERLIEKTLSKYKGRAIKSAFMKGFVAARELGLEARNPYKLITKPDGGATFAAAFYNAWADGWNHYRNNRLTYHPTFLFELPEEKE